MPPHSADIFLPVEHDEELFQDAPCGYVSTLPDGTFIKVNQTFLDWSGYARGELVGARRLQDLLTPAGRAFYETHYAPALQQQGQASGIAFDMVGRQGQRLSCFCNASVKKDAQGQPAAVRTILFDAGDRREYEKELLAARRQALESKARLEYLAEHDPLTHLPNRQSFETRLADALQRVDKSGGTLAVVHVYLDHLEEVHENWGREACDQLLAGVAERFLTHRRPNRTLARIDGEAFAMLLEGEDNSQATDVADTLLADLTQPFEVRGATVSIGASIGVAVCPEAGVTGHDLMRSADRAMYAARMAGGVQVRRFTAAAAQREEREARLRQDLPAAVQQRAFVLHYHAKVDLPEGRLIGAEALLRWKHPAHQKLLYPADFLHLIEASPARALVFEWIVDEVCRQLAQWKHDGGPQLPVSVNLSAWQLSDAKLPELMARAAARHGVAHEQLELEITEGGLIADEKRASDVLRELARLGFAISLDDFGTGYSGLAYLRKFPIRGIKIDKSFVQGLADDPSSRTLAGAIVAFGRSVGLHVLAEGVETTTQRDFLASIGCEAIQGFLIARPMAADAFQRFVADYEA